MADCVFCDVLDGTEPAVVAAHYRHCIVIESIKPVIDGHLLFIPRYHHSNALTGPLAARCVGVLVDTAATYAYERGWHDANIITSAGRAATQTVDHLHVHLIPRHPGDGLRIPWGKEAHEHKPKPRRGTIATETTP